MKRREFLRNAALVAATSGIPDNLMAESSRSLLREETGNSTLIDSEPVLQNYAETSMGIAFSVTDWANGYVIFGEKPDLSDGRKVWCGGYRLTAMDNEAIQVRLTGLKPGTLYYYRIGADRIEYKDGYHIRITGNEEPERIYSFRTAGKEAKAHFCVINDTHASWKAFNPTINKVMELQPGCVIWNGDACNTEETVAAQKRIFFKPEIDLRGARLQEALEEVMHYCDDAQMLGIGSVRIIHGKGTGVLREEIQKYLRTVPGVASVADEDVRHGGTGVTIVTFG